MNTAINNLAAKEQKPDYPSFLPPILVKELRQVLQARAFPIVFLGMHILMILVLAMSLISRESSNVYFSIMNGLFWGLLTILLLISIPMSGANALRSEIENKSIDLLLLTQLSARNIILGKWASLLTFASLIMLSLLPYGVLRYFFGSVNLLSDIKLLAGLFLLSATLGALSIWSSGQAKILRILIPIGIVVLLQSSAFSYLATRSIRVSPGGTPSPFSAFSLTGAELLAGGAVLVLLLVFFLLHGARRITPVAVNDVVPIRALPLVAILLAVISMFIKSNQGQMIYAFVYTVAIMGIELAQSRPLMPVHWKAWCSKNALLRSVGLGLLPGWVSASLFLCVPFSLFAIAGLDAKLRVLGPRVDFTAYFWWLVLAWQALVFPAAIFSLLPRSAQRWSGPGLFFVVHGLMGILTLFAVNLSTTTFPSLKVTLEAIANIIPISSFWMYGYNAKSGAFLSGSFIGQSIVMAGTLALFWLQSKPSLALLRKVSRDQAAIAKRTTVEPAR